MKHALLWLLPACALMAQDKDPFAEDKSSGHKAGDMEYDFDEVHSYEDVRVRLGEPTDPKWIQWSPPVVASHREVAGKCQSFSFHVDSEMYQEALRHPDLNRGVRLMSGDPRFPLFTCWLRPFSIDEKMAWFVVKVPLDRPKGMCIAFIPETGKKRHLYDLDEVALYFENKTGSKNE
jgi:hypothetical protein